MGANGELASSIEGQIVSIADKIDTICALFISTQGSNKKKRPTGSNDPLGARRAAIGILRTVIENKLNINLQDLIKYSINVLSKEFSIEIESTLFDELKEFFVQRLVFMYEKEFSSNVISSISEFNPLTNLADFIKRAEILTKYQTDSDFALIKENATRVSRILKDNKFDSVDEKLFVVEEESALYEAILDHKAIEELDLYIQSLKSLIQPTANFFEKVLVMDKDESIKNNRIALLNKLKEKFEVVCDFEKL